MKLVFCTNNDHKIQEVSQILGNQFSYLKLNDIGFNDEIPEPFDTLEENSNIKANIVFEKTGYNTFAEDTGLFIEALDGEPGVYSARYAGEPTDSTKNMEKVLSKLKHVVNRKAYFKTVVTIIIEGTTHQFSGSCNGNIALEQSGQKGFGYDPIFIPNESSVTFAELTAEEKNKFSHRRKAFDQFATFLKQYYS